MATNAEVIVEMKELRKELQATVVAVARERAISEERQKRMDDLAEEVWGNGGKGLKSDMQDVKKDVRQIRLVSWACFVAFLGVVGRIVILAMQ